MEFEIRFYRNNKGDSPIEEFLDKLELKDRLLFNQTLKGFEKLKNKIYHKEPLSKYLELGLWELRIKSETNVLRVIYTYEKGQVIILLNIFIKKQQKTPSGELEIARKRLKELKIKRGV